MWGCQSPEVDKSSGTYCCVNWQIITDLLKEAAVSTAYPQEGSSKLSSNTTLCVYQHGVIYQKKQIFLQSYVCALKSLPTLVTLILLDLGILLIKLKSHLLSGFPHTILLTERDLTPALTLLTSIQKVPSLNLSQGHMLSWLGFNPVLLSLSKQMPNEYSKLGLMFSTSLPIKFIIWCDTVWVMICGHPQSLQTNTKTVP